MSGFKSFLILIMRVIFSRSDVFVELWVGENCGGVLCGGVGVLRWVGAGW